MFFKKKSQSSPPTANIPQELTIFHQIATTLFYGVNGGDDAASVTAQLSFDTQQRVSSIDGLLVNDAPKLPDPDVLEAINKVSAQLLAMDEKYRLKGLNVKVVDGGVSTSAEYLT